MRRILLIVSILCCNISFSQEPIVKFACIGDYGKAGTNELNVSNLVKSWLPEFIITAGDNNYELGQQSTIDTNIGYYYSEFIYPYIGNHGTGDTVNRFFPSLGNHDWYTSGATPYLNYFTLPGNERYYDFVKGNVHFFAIDSDPNEPDGVDSNSVQALWLKNALQGSKQKWNIVYFHHPPYSSSSHGSEEYMQWPFKRWGATTVIAGHDHTYERLLIDSLLYFVNGLGGKSIYSFYSIVEGSKFRYNSNYGAMLINSYNDSMVFRFYSVSGNMRDYYILQPPKKSLAMRVLIQGFYDPVADTSGKDTVKVQLRNFQPPYALVDSSAGVTDSNGNVNLLFSAAENLTNYYVVVRHRNSVETWSSSGHSFEGNVMSIDLTLTAASAYGNNTIQIDSAPVAFAIYGGDVDQNGSVDATDAGRVDNDAADYSFGYLPTDLTGDGYVDGTDFRIADNNAREYVIVISP
jgi:hypothetical protein